MVAHPVTTTLQPTRRWGGGRQLHRSPPLNRTAVDTVAVRRVRTTKLTLADEVVDRADCGHVNACQRSHHLGAVEFDCLAGDDGGAALRESCPSQTRCWSS